MNSRPLFLFSIVISALAISVAHAEQQGTLIFEDNFDRNESQEATEEIGHGWGSNSKKRAGGNKQVDLKDGAMHIYIHETADHGVSVTHPAGFRNGTVSLRFMLEDQKDNLGLNFADLKFKEVHAGHLCVAKISTKGIQLNDLKTGVMSNRVYALKKAKKLTPEIQKELKTKSKQFPGKLATGKWYDLTVRIVDDTLSVSIDGKQLASLSSEGIAHPTKRTLRLAVPRNAVVDDVKIYSLAN